MPTHPPPPPRQDALSDSLYGAQTRYLEAIYAHYRERPQEMEAEWKSLFQSLDKDLPAPAPAAARASWAKPLPPPNGWDSDSPAAPAAASDSASAAPATRREVLDSIRAIMMIRAYRMRGHLTADLDPLRLAPPEPHPELNPAAYGFSEKDWDRPIFIDYVLGLERATLREILAILKKTYCGALGVEFMHISDPEEKAWMQHRIEGRDKGFLISDEARRALLRLLIQVEGFEKFLALRFTGTKRFGLDGAEMMIPAIARVIETAAPLGVKEIVLGMPHRGRLNVLAHVLDWDLKEIFHAFQGGGGGIYDVEGSGDVKYHLGASATRSISGHEMHLSLAANPSHLESVDPVVLGKARAKQDQIGDTTRSRVMPLLLHGDAAFAGQGVVAECFSMSGLKGHKSGGAVHLIVNNQIGFTTSPRHARSSPYPSDLAKMVETPILHVNGDDPEAVLYAATIATEFRQAFQKPVIIDMFCYRRFGHNETDEPMFTQPLMYKRIKTHPSVASLYRETLEAEGLLAAGEAEGFAKKTRARYDEELKDSAARQPKKAQWLDGRWSGFTRSKGHVRRGQTGVKGRILRQIGMALTEIPESFSAHPTARRLMAARRRMIESGEAIDWATAEALAFGTLLREGYPVRLTGQDSERGTFSQRHSVLTDQETEESHTPLNNLAPDQARYEVVNSLLSEEAVLGFEYGYSLSEPKALVLWEAQFGDFANNAQVIIDQFIAAGERKWLRMSGLVMLLPHGYEGQGPEHSSARLERYLQLCAEDNLQVASCTTPANYFHILRRQMHRTFRKPLILMTPKSLLRHKECQSPLDHFRSRASFHRILPDGDEARLAEKEAIRKLVLCSGKVYYDLLAARRERQDRHLYLLRVEQLYPFPLRAVAHEIKRFPKARILWCQEEPANMGAWSFARPYLDHAQRMAGRETVGTAYVGRSASAATATGFFAQHQRESEKIIAELFGRVHEREPLRLVR